MYHYNLETLYNLFRHDSVKRPNGFKTPYRNWLGNQARTLLNRGMIKRDSEAHKKIRDGFACDRDFDLIMSQQLARAGNNPDSLTPDDIKGKCGGPVKYVAPQDERVATGVKLTVSENLNTEPIESKLGCMESPFEKEPDGLGLPVLKHSFTPAPITTTPVLQDDEEIVRRELLRAENAKPRPNWVSSRKVAEVLGRNHKDILRSIRNFESSPEFNRRNITLVDYLDSKGEQRPEYIMSPDAFIWLITELRGCGELKERVIEDYKDAREKREESKPKTIEDQLVDQAIALRDHSRRIKVIETKTTEIEVKVDDLGDKVKEQGEKLDSIPEIVEDKRGCPSHLITNSELNTVPMLAGVNNVHLCAVLRMKKYPGENYMHIYDIPDTGEVGRRRNWGWLREGIEKAIKDFVALATYQKTTENNHCFKFNGTQVRIPIGKNGYIESCLDKRQVN